MVIAKVSILTHLPVGISIFFFSCQSEQDYYLVHNDISTAH